MKKHEIITSELIAIKEDINNLRSRSFNEIDSNIYSLKNAYSEGLFDAYCDVWRRLVTLIESIERGDIFEDH